MIPGSTTPTACPTAAAESTDASSDLIIQLVFTPLEELLPSHAARPSVPIKGTGDVRTKGNWRKKEQAAIEESQRSSLVAITDAQKTKATCLNRRYPTPQPIFTLRCWGME